MSHQKEGYLWECSSHAACIGVSDSMIEPGLNHLPEAPTPHSVLPAPNYRAADGQTQVFRLWTSRYRDEGWKWQEVWEAQREGRPRLCYFRGSPFPFNLQFLLELPFETDPKKTSFGVNILSYFLPGRIWQLVTWSRLMRLPLYVLASQLIIHLKYFSLLASSSLNNEEKEPVILEAETSDPVTIN